MLKSFLLLSVICASFGLSSLNTISSDDQSDSFCINRSLPSQDENKTLYPNNIYVDLGNNNYLTDTDFKNPYFLYNDGERKYNIFGDSLKFYYDTDNHPFINYNDVYFMDKDFEFDNESIYDVVNINNYDFGINSYVKTYDHGDIWCQSTEEPNREASLLIGENSLVRIGFDTSSQTIEINNVSNYLVINWAYLGEDITDCNFGFFVNDIYLYENYKDNSLFTIDPVEIEEGKYGNDGCFCTSVVDISNITNKVDISSLTFGFYSLSDDYYDDEPSEEIPAVAIDYFYFTDFPVYEAYLNPDVESLDANEEIEITDFIFSLNDDFAYTVQQMTQMEEPSYWLSFEDELFSQCLVSSVCYNVTGDYGGDFLRTYKLIDLFEDPLDDKSELIKAKYVNAMIIADIYNPLTSRITTHIFTVFVSSDYINDSVKTFYNVSNLSLFQTYFCNSTIGYIDNDNELHVLNNYTSFSTDTVDFDSSTNTFPFDKTKFSTISINRTRINLSYEENSPYGVNNVNDVFTGFALYCMDGEEFFEGYIYASKNNNEAVIEYSTNANPEDYATWEARWSFDYIYDEENKVYENVIYSINPDFGDDKYYLMANSNTKSLVLSTNPVEIGYLKRLKFFISADENDATAGEDGEGAFIAEELFHASDFNPDYSGTGLCSTEGYIDKILTAQDAHDDGLRLALTMICSNENKSRLIAWGNACGKTITVGPKNNINYYISVTDKSKKIIFTSLLNETLEHNGNSILIFASISFTISTGFYFLFKRRNENH